MEIIIKDNYIDLDKLYLKKGKHNIKILYNFGSVFMIGICLQIKTPFQCSQTNLEKIELQNKEQIQLFETLNSYFSSKIKEYVPFMRNNIIYVKNNISPENIYININNIKYIHGKNYINIFSL